jgi:molybdopterin-containing oxidoreductase family membrane subunit
MAEHIPPGAPGMSNDPMTAVAHSGVRDHVIAPGHTFGSVTDKISSIVLTHKTSIGWYLGFLTAAAGAGMLLISLAYLSV